jgi:hypothetical protein
MERSSDHQTASQAIARMLDAGQRLVVENVRLARVELNAELGWWARHGVWFAAAVAMAVSAWGLLSVGMVLVLSPRVGVAQAVLLIGAANLVAAVAFFGLGIGLLMRRRAGRSPMPARGGAGSTKIVPARGEVGAAVGK